MDVDLDEIVLNASRIDLRFFHPAGWEALEKIVVFNFRFDENFVSPGQ
ncbi:MAG: hypothetical protein GWN10_21305 [Nitrospinaceae bacterium]|nr:hypothetical protein [Nitrospinaceae bacterium]NIU46492.1 hypothetical protein [Nitrospinaceae bacterium]NIW08050.1 hypothetical protein [Nitrospinaceae bacterium]NIX36653.1 hypothetical protein [Nitrospinaceae bacterium]